MVVTGLAGIIQSTGVWKLRDVTLLLGKVSPPTPLPLGYYKGIQVMAYFYSSFQQTHIHTCV